MLPGPHLRCRQLGPCPCPPRGLGGSSSPQPPPPAPPSPTKPPARVAPSRRSACCCSSGASGSVPPGNPQLSPLQHTAVPRGCGGPGDTVPIHTGGPDTARQGGSPHCQLSPAPSGLWQAAQCWCLHIARGRGPPPTLPAAAPPCTPAPARPALGLVLGHKSVIKGYLPPDQLAASSTSGPQTGRGTPNEEYVALPGSRPPCPSAPTSLAAPLPALPGAAAAPCHTGARARSQAAPPRWG